MKKINLILWVFVALVFACSCEDQTGEYVEHIYNNAQKEAAIRGCLNSSIDTAAKHLFVSGGFMQNDEYRIDYSTLNNTVFATLNEHGAGYLADSLILNTNRLAESCHGFLASIMKNTVKELTIADYNGLIYGDSTSITDYYAMVKYMALRDSLQSPIDIRMSVFSVKNLWGDIMTQYNNYNNTPVSFDVRNYIIDNMLQAIFAEMRKEEAKIRVDTSHCDANTTLFGNIRK